ncbi:MAG TPA: hypothetical protein VMV14_04805 [Acidimicrobiales bacterium]|nr:hypothetical protein [Acidimicrobiales bacterium]
MSRELAELSSLTTALAEITSRIAAIAEQAARSKDDALSSELFAVERALNGASRRLGRLVTPSDRPRR